MVDRIIFGIFTNFLHIFIFDTAINAACETLKEQGYECTGYVVDISDRSKVYEAAIKVQEEVGNVDILINNAGIVTCRPFLELSDKAIETTYNVNILSHYWVSKTMICFVGAMSMTCCEF